MLHGRMCYCWNRGWEARRPDLAGKLARMGTGRLGGLRVFFFYGNTHFVVFSGGVERGLGGMTVRSSWKINQNGGWQARQLDLSWCIHPPPPPPPPPPAADCDLDLGHRNLTLVRDTPSHYVLSSCEVLFCLSFLVIAET